MAITYTQAAKQIRALGFRVSRLDGEIRVGFPGNESAAYYTMDPADALATAQHMAAQAEADAEGEAIERGEHIPGEVFDTEADAEARAEADGIELGETGPDWEPVAATRFYASRPDAPGQPFAFGATKADALAALLEQSEPEQSEPVPAVDYATPVAPLTQGAEHCVWGWNTPPEQVRAASYAFHRQAGKTARAALSGLIPALWSRWSRHGWTRTGICT